MESIFSLKIKCLMVNVMLLSVIPFPGYLYGSIEGTSYLKIRMVIQMTFVTILRNNSWTAVKICHGRRHNYLTWHCSIVAITKLFSKCSETTRKHTHTHTHTHTQREKTYAYVMIYQNIIRYDYGIRTDSYNVYISKIYYQQNHK